ncbi:hypothetical protein Tco_0918458 [Tanacetum coccineum]
MENSKRKSIPMQEKLRLSKSQGDSTHAELKRMQNVPYASAWVFYLVIGNRMLRTSISDWICVSFLNGSAVDWKSASKAFLLLHLKARSIAVYDASKESFGYEIHSGLVLFPQVEDL